MNARRSGTVGQVDDRLAVGFMESLRDRRSAERVPIEPDRRHDLQRTGREKDAFRLLQLPAAAAAFRRRQAEPSRQLDHEGPRHAGQQTFGERRRADHAVLDPEQVAARGFGETAIKRGRREGGTPPQLLAKELRDFLDALGLGPVDIVSHDVGSFVAQAFAQAYPGSVRRLFFFNCAYPGIGARWGDAANFSELWYQQFHQKDFAAALVGSSRDAARMYYKHFLTHWTHQKGAIAPYLEEWVDNFMRPGNIQGGFDWYTGVAAFRRRMMQGDAMPRVKIAAPTYVLWGRHDPVLQYAWTDKLGDYFETLTLECAEDAGHFVHFEVPELANSRVARFLA